MKPEFEHYEQRKIDFVETISVNEFKVKIYTITNRSEFESQATLTSCIEALPNWLNNAKGSTIPTHRHAFLIVHEAREGVLILLSWWTGENMVETKIYFADFKTPADVKISIYNPKQLVCIWELEVFYHERKAWIKHVLSKSNKPDFIAYQNDYYSQVYERIS